MSDGDGESSLVRVRPDPYIASGNESMAPWSDVLRRAHQRDVYRMPILVWPQRESAREAVHRDLSVVA